MSDRTARRDVSVCIYNNENVISTQLPQTFELFILARSPYPCVTEIVQLFQLFCERLETQMVKIREAGTCYGV